MDLEHVGIAVDDAEAALAVMEALLGERPYKSESVEAEGVRTHFIRAGGAKLELLEASSDASPIARHLARRGPGLHHLAIEVDDLEAVHDRLTTAGFEVLGVPHPGADGKQVFFVHPRKTGGVLFEFCQSSRSILAESTLTTAEDGRSILTESALSAAEASLRVRRAGTRGPITLVVGTLAVEVELLARRLEQSARVVVMDDHSLQNGGGEDADASGAVEWTSAAVAATRRAYPDDSIHLILPSRFISSLSMAGGSDIRSLTIVVDTPIDLSRVDRPTLVVAKQSAASAATSLFERLPGSTLTVGDDHLLAIAIEDHIRRVDRT